METLKHSHNYFVSHRTLMSVKTVACFFLGICLLVSPAANNVFALPQTDGAHQLKITDEKDMPLYGVYIVLKHQNYLITTSDADGICSVDQSFLAQSDSLMIYSMGYETRIMTGKELAKQHTVRLKTVYNDLPEISVVGISIPQLLKDAAQNLTRLPRTREPLCRDYGMAAYSKITEAKDSTLEYRKEHGYYFTSGNVPPRNTWDVTYRSYFVPVYGERSYNLTNNASDTLSNLYVTTEGIRYDAGTRKIFTLMRIVQLYAPLFADTRYYDIRSIDTDSPDYTFSFSTKLAGYPREIRIFCNGTFVIGKEDHRLKSMNFEFLDYQLYRQPILSDIPYLNSPYSTKAELTFAYTEQGTSYIQSCRQTTLWKHNLDEKFIAIEQPSRIYPAQIGLVEKEAFYCYNYRELDKRWQNERILTKIHAAQRNPLSYYYPEFLNQLPELLESGKNLAALNRFMDIEQQFEHFHNKPYYPPNYQMGFNYQKRTDREYLLELKEVRDDVLKIVEPMDEFSTYYKDKLLTRLALSTAYSNSKDLTPLAITKNLTTDFYNRIPNRGLQDGIIRDTLLIFRANPDKDPDKKCFHIYETKHLNHVLGFGQKGKLTTEFLYPYFYPTITLDEKAGIELYDVYMAQRQEIRLSNILKGENTSKNVIGNKLPSRLAYSYNLNRIDSNTVIGQNAVESDGAFFIYTYDRDLLKWIKFTPEFNFPNRDYQTDAYTNCIVANPSRNSVVVGFRYFDMVQVYDLSGKLLKSLNFSTLKMPKLSTEENRVSEESTVYTQYIYATDKYCYIARLNPLKQGEEMVFNHIIVMDWNGNIKEVYRADNAIYPIVNKDNTRLFSVLDDKDPAWQWIMEYKINP